MKYFRQLIESLLRTSAQASPKTDALLVACLEDTPARGCKLNNPCPQLALQTRIGGGEPGGRGHRIHKPRITEDRLIVDEDRYGLAVPLNQRCCALRARFGDANGLALGVD